MLDKVAHSDSCGLKKEIIVIDDGSNDGTRDILKKYRNKKEFKIFFHTNNSGKGSALKKGFGETTGDIVLVQDADLEYDPLDYPILISPIIENRADVVYGSRFMGQRPHRVIYYWHSVMNSILTKFSNIMTNINLTDMESCYKVFRGDLIRKIAPDLESQRFGFEPEITARLSKVKNIRFYEVGVSYYGRTYEEGKHINWTDGIKAVWEIIKYNVFSR